MKTAKQLNFGFKIFYCSYCLNAKCSNTKGGSYIFYYYYLIDIFIELIMKREGRGTKRCSFDIAPNVSCLVKTLISRTNDACGDRIT